MLHSLVDSQSHDVAVLYLSRGMVNNAIRHFEISAALKPGSAAAHFNLGTAQAQGGRFEAAIASFRTAADTNRGGWWTALVPPYEFTFQSFRSADEISANVLRVFPGSWPRSRGSMRRSVESRSQ